MKAQWAPKKFLLEFVENRRSKSITIEAFDLDTARKAAVQWVSEEWRLKGRKIRVSYISLAN